MKKKLLILIGSCMALLSTVQSATVWRQQGIAVSIGNDTSHTTIYVGGDMQFANGNASSPAPSMCIEKSRIKLTGNLLNDVANGNQGGNLFINSSLGNYGVLEFCGTESQAITTSGTLNSNSPSKLFNYIAFPNLEINNGGHVTLDARLAAKTHDITLTKGWLVLDSKLAQTNIDGGVDVNPEQESVLAHLLVEGTIDYKENTWSIKPANERGFIQVNLKVPVEEDKGQDIGRSIVGFGIPFAGMYNDYFMFNTLLEPQVDATGAGFLGKAPLTDPKTLMLPGKGYVVGIDLRGDDVSVYPELDDYKGIISFSERATDGYRFNRNAFASYAPRNQVFGNDPSSNAYTIEKLNTGDVKISLKEGYNYLSNPFTCPLNIDKLMGENQASSTWNIHSAEWTDGIDMWNRVWILAPNSRAETTADIYRSKYTYNYQVAMKDGGTYIDNDNIAGVTSIAPLQMFVIYSCKEMDITIPKSERVMGTTRFLRNASQENTRRDDFIIEFRDISTRTTDRASIVLREQKELEDGGYTNVERLQSSSTENGNGIRVSTLKSAQAHFPQSLASQIYTKNASGKALTVQFFPLETTHRVTLYHVPSSKAQPLHILGLRLNTKDKVTRIWLEDHKYNTETEIAPDMVYETYSEPTDSHERFVLCFSTETVTSSDKKIETSNIYGYTQQGSIYVAGFEDTDLNNTVELFDINGRLIVQKKSSNNTVKLFENYTPGVYIIKVNGQQLKFIKLLAK